MLAAESGEILVDAAVARAHRHAAEGRAHQHERAEHSRPRKRAVRSDGRAEIVADDVRCRQLEAREQLRGVLDEIQLL